MRKLIPLTLLLSACAAAELPRNVPPGEQDPATVEAKFAASEEGAAEVAEFRFRRGSAGLSPEAQRRIARAVARARAAGELAEIRIVAWPDKNSAGLKNDSLSSADRELARRRLDAIEGALGSVAAEKHAHNMAESPDAWDRLFQRADFRLKRALQRAGAKVEGSGSGTASMAGKGIVMVSVKVPPN